MRTGNSLSSTTGPPTIRQEGTVIFGISIYYVEYDGRSGCGGARNTGACHASGAYLAFLGDDDDWTPHKLAVQVARMKVDPGIGLVAGRCTFVDENLEPTGYVSRAPEEVRYEEICVSTSIPCSASTVEIRREAF